MYIKIYPEKGTIYMLFCFCVIYMKIDIYQIQTGRDPYFKNEFGHVLIVK